MKKHKHRKIKNLSQQIEPISLNNKTLRLQSKKITNIDKISSYIGRDITTLDLSNNYITILNELNQFSNLTTINLINNSITQGRQLLKLYTLFKLKTVYISGNPFLQDPLDQDVLQFILQKETDIQILSGQALKTIKQIQIGQLKLIFLENYLKKIAYHQQLLTKVQTIDKDIFNNKNQYNYNSNNNEFSKSLLKSKSNAHSIINKIIPQYYDYLQSSHIKNKVRKQTVQMKRQQSQKQKQKITFQQIIQLKKKNQQAMVENLIKDILALVQDQNNNIQSSYSFDQKKQKQEDQFYDKLFQSSFRNRWMRSSPDSKKKQIYKSRISSQSPERNLRLPESIQTQRKLAHAASQSHIKKQFQSLLRKSRQKSKRSFQKLNQSMILRQKQNFNKTQQLKNIPQIQEGDSTPIYISVISPKSGQQTLNFKKSFFNSNTNFLGTTSLNNSSIDLGLQNFQTVYYRNLTKANPIYQLLYSPLNSLSSEQKTLLLQNLSKNHKDISIQLLRYRRLTNQLKQQLRIITTQKEIQTQKLASFWKQSRQIAIAKTEQLQNQVEQNKRLKQMFSSTILRVKQLQLSNKQKNQIIQANQRQYKKLQQKCLDIMNTNKTYDSYDYLEQAIIQKRQTNIKKQYLSKLIKKANHLNSLKKIQLSIKEKQQKRLKNLIFSSFKRYKLVNDYINMKQKQRSHKAYKLCAKIWFEQYHIQKKQKILKLYFKRLYFQTFFKITSLQKNNNNVNCFKNERSIKCYQQKKYKSIFKFLKTESKRNKDKYQRVYQFMTSKIKSKYFLILKQLRNTKYRNIANVQNSIRLFRKKHFFDNLHNIIQCKKDISNFKSLLKLFLLKRAMKDFKIRIKKQKIKLQKKVKRSKKILTFLKTKLFFEQIKSKKRMKTTYNNLQNQNKPYQISFAQYHQNILQRLSNVNFTNNYFDYINNQQIRLKQKSISLQWKLQQLTIKSFFQILSKRLNQNKKTNIKLQHLNLLLNSNKNQKLKKFYSKLRLNALKTRQKIRQDIINQQHLRRQHQWIEKLSFQDSNVEKLMQQVSQLHRQLAYQKTHNIDNNQQIQQLRAILQHKDKIINKCQQETSDKYQDLQIQNQKYSKLLQLYGQAIDALDKKEQDCLWLIETIQKQKNNNKNNNTNNDRNTNQYNHVNVKNIVQKGNNYMSQRVQNMEKQSFVGQDPPTAFDSPLKRQETDKFRYLSGSTRKKYARNNLMTKKQ